MKINKTSQIVNDKTSIYAWLSNKLAEYRYYMPLTSFNMKFKIDWYNGIIDGKRTKEDFVNLLNMSLRHNHVDAQLSI